MPTHPMGPSPLDPALEPRVVSVRRPRPVQLAVRAVPATDSEPAHTQVLADAHPIAQIRVAPPAAALLGVLLAGPAWLTLVAAEFHSEVVCKVWALIPADRETAATVIALTDEEPVYAVPVVELGRKLADRVHPGDLRAEAGHLLDSLLRAPPGPA